MTRIKTILFLSLFSLSAGAQTIDNEAGATVIKPLTIWEDRAFDFGIIVPSTTESGIVTINHNGVTCPNSLTCMGTSHTAIVGLSGELGYHYTLTPEESFYITSGTDQMLVETTGTGNHKILDQGSGTDTTYIFGQLHVGANQAPGNYIGSYNVSAEYQ